MNKEKGFSLIEVVVSIAIMGVISVGFLHGMGAASESLFTADKMETAKNLAESQMEYAKGQPYAFSYDPAPIPDEYPGYSASISAAIVASRGANVQRLVVSIEHEGKEVLELEGYKVN